MKLPALFALLLGLGLANAIEAQPTPDDWGKYLDRHRRLDARKMPALLGDLAHPSHAKRLQAFQTLTRLEDCLSGLNEDGFAMLRCLVADNDDADFRPGLQALMQRLRQRHYGDARRRLVGHLQSPCRLIFSPDSTRLASASFDGTARVWDAMTGQQRLVVRPAGNSCVYGIAFSPDGTRLATAGEGVNLWDAADGRLLARHPEAGGDLQDVQFARDGHHLYAGCRRGKPLVEWSVATGRRERTWKCGYTSVFRFAKDGRQLFTFPIGVSCWDTASGKNLWFGDRGKSIIDDSWAAAFVLHLRDDGRRIIGVTNRGSVYDYDVRNGKVTRPVAIEKYRPYCAAFTTDARRLVVPVDGPAPVLLLLDYPSGQVLHRWRRPGNDTMMLAALAVSPDERRVAAADGQGAIGLYAIPQALRRR